MTWVHIAKEFKFEAAHQLWNTQWDEETNKLEFGKCASLHGHSYKIEVQVGGDVDIVHGWVMDYAHLKEIVDSAVINRWDHKFLNDLFGEGLRTTAENIALVAFHTIETEMQHNHSARGVLLERVRIKETASTFAEVTR